MPRANRSESQVKEMVRKELRWREPFYSSRHDDEGGNSSSTESEGEVEHSVDKAVQDPSIPPASGCPLLDTLVSGNPPTF